MNDYPHYVIYQSPKEVGYYHIGGLKIAIHEKPHWLARTMMRVVFGWMWEDKV